MTSNLKITDYLEIIEKFRDKKEISDYIDDVEKLRRYFRMQQFEEMQNHIIELTQKYREETVLWNTVYNVKPTTYQQSYINAENFLCAYGVKLVVEKVFDYKKLLSQEEIDFIESVIKIKGENYGKN